MSDDTISRKAAIDAHYEYCNQHPDAGFPVWSLKILEDLPSAQPEKRTEERTETHACDLISRQDAIDALDKRFDSIPMEQTTEILLLRKDLRELPSAQPDLIAKIQNGINATNANDSYSCGMRNGMRWCMSLVDDKEPLFENCPSAQPTGAPLHDSGTDYAHGFADGYKQGLKDAESERVRCKDCLYWVAHDKRCVYLNHGFAPNMWCCHGRRADD